MKYTSMYLDETELSFCTQDRCDFEERAKELLEYNVFYNYDYITPIMLINRKYPYYKEYEALESLKSSISSYLGLGYSIYDINAPTIDRIVDYIDTFRAKG